MQRDGYSLLLPAGTLDYFDVVNVIEDSTQIVIYLEEKNIVPPSTAAMIPKVKDSSKRRLFRTSPFVANRYF